jgi:hypothetical protein
MKSAITTTALSSLLLSFVALTSFQASSASLPSASQQPLMLAEGGGDRLFQNRELQAQRVQTTDDESERFARMVEDKPTAAGSQTDDDDVESIANPAPHDKSPIQHQNVDYEY